MNFNLKLFIAIFFLLSAQALIAAQSICETGAYRSERGDMVVLTPKQPGHYRFVFADGRWGNTAEANPLAFCREGKVFVKQSSGAIEIWKQVPLRITRTFFKSDGTMLSGMLVEPAAAGAKDKPPLMVQVHGSNNTGWINGRDEFSFEPYAFAAHGISVFAGSPQSAVRQR
jgi:hypothetical protein